MVDYFHTVDFDQETGIVVVTMIDSNCRAAVAAVEEEVEEVKLHETAPAMYLMILRTPMGQQVQCLLEGNWLLDLKNYWYYYP